jgi:hypothetical protein
MRNKILIHVDHETGKPVIIIEKTEDNSPGIPDVRDSLIERFIENGHFAVATFDKSNNVVLKSMNPLDLLANIKDWFGSTTDKEYNDKFEQAIAKLHALIETRYGYKSTAFLKKVEAQQLVYGCQAPHDYKIDDIPKG